MAVVTLESISVGGKAAQFADRPGTSFLVLRGDPADDQEGLCAGDVFAVTEGVDVEAGDLVVWWTGVERTLALARVQADLSFTGVGGFPPPSDEQPARVRGVVVGRLRQFLQEDGAAEA